MMYLLALVRLVISRAVATPGLLAIRCCGVLVAISLVAGVSLYSGAMGDAMLQARLQNDPSSLSLAISNTSGSLDAATYGRLDRYIRYEESADLGLPLKDLHLHHTTTVRPLYRAATLAGGRGTALAELALDYYEGFADQVRIVAGRLDMRDRAPDGDVPVLLSRYTAQSLGLRVGDRVVFSYDGRQRLGWPMVVAGVFVAKDSNSLFWDINAGLTTYRSLVAPNLGTFLSFATIRHTFNPGYFWLNRLDLKAVHLADADMILNHLQRIGNKGTFIAPGTTLIESLSLDIDGFLIQYNLLPFILLILVTPIAALVLYAVAVTTALVLDRQASEIVLMRSRGAARSQVFGIYVLEGILLGVVGTVIGPLLGLPLARLIGNASGFLQFGGGLPFDLRLTWQTYALAAGTALLSLLVGLIPAVGLSRRSMLAYKQEQARLGQRPLWQRLFLDLVVMVVALYGLFVLIRQGPVTSGAGTAAIAQDPIIGIAPLLFAVAITLFISRILPWLAALGVHLLSRSSSPPAHLAMQSVARAPRQPMRLVQLCTLTLALGVFAATVASVEGSNLADQQMYQAGSPLRLTEYNLSTKQWEILPLADHLKLPGVHAAAPALRFETFGSLSNTTGDGTNVNVLGIDAAGIKGLIWFRPDFADQPLDSLLGAIAAPGPNAIVSDTFLSATGLHRGDQFDVSLSNNTTVQARVAAVAHYFPTLDPHEYPFVVMNLAYLQRASKSRSPSEVWLATDKSPGTVDTIIALTRQWPRRIEAYQGLTPTFSAQDQPLTAGIYGVVSVGFLIAIVLSLLGFFAYAYLSLQRRLTEFAIVRALGLSSGQLRWLLLFEQFFLLGAGILGGLAAGVLTTKLFLPYLPIATNTMPPFLVAMPWLAVAEFIVAVLIVFALVLSSHVYVLLRLQLGRVLRLGEG